MTELSRHHSLDLAKMFFIYVVVVFHSRLLDGIINHGYIGVEFFFIVSGFFLYHNYIYSNKSIILYAKNRILRLYPHYIFSFIIMLFTSKLVGNFSREKYNVIAELFMCQNIGLSLRGGVNYPCWYLSVLLWGSLLLYAMLKYTKKSIKQIVLLLLPILYYCYSVFLEDGRAEIWNTFHGIYLPMIRGLADMSIGIILYKVYDLIKDYSFYKNKWLINFIEMASFFGIVFMIIYPGNMDYVTICLMMIFILSLLSRVSMFERIGKIKIIEKISEIEYAVFLNHAVIVMLFKKFIIGKVHWRVSGILLLLLVVVTVYSWITTRIIDVFKQMTKYSGEML